LCPIVSVAADDFFFREGDKGDSMFVLEMGKAAVLKSWRGQDHLLRTLNEGDCFGEMAVMDHCPRSASVRAVEDCIAIHVAVYNVFNVQRHLVSRRTLRVFRAQAMLTWRHATVAA
jgi:CRP/FNR family cyclic AMP-dependent transcriptional regulator